MLRRSRHFPSVSARRGASVSSTQSLPFAEPPRVSIRPGHRASESARRHAKVRVSCRRSRTHARTSRSRPGSPTSSTTNRMRTRNRSTRSRCCRNSYATSRRPIRMTNCAARNRRRVAARRHPARSRPVASAAQAGNSAAASARRRRRRPRACPSPAARHGWSAWKADPAVAAPPAPPGAACRIPGWVCAPWFGSMAQ